MIFCHFVTILSFLLSNYHYSVRRKTFKHELVFRQSLLMFIMVTVRVETEQPSKTLGESTKTPCKGEQAAVHSGTPSIALLLL